MGQHRVRVKSVSRHGRVFRRTALASAVAAAMVPMTAASQDWGRNVELFITPTTKHRNIFGGQLLQPLWQNNDALTYFDFRGNSNVGKTEELNMGLGYRQLVADRRWILGGFGSFDIRNSDTSHVYTQFTVGLEALSTNWDLRTNFYVPLSHRHLVGTVAGVPTGSAYFTGYDLIQPYTHGANIFEEALTGVDAEIGHLVPFIPFGETRVFVGAYYFNGSSVPSTGTGLKARIEFRPWKNIILGVTTKHDNLFGTETLAQVKYSFGYKHESGVRSVDERMIQFAERDIDVVETSLLPFRQRTLTDYSTPDHQDISDHVVHIRNNAAGGGDGTFEHPYDSIDACQSGGPGTCGFNTQDAIVYVHTGSGDSTGLNTTLTLHNNERLIGQGFSFYGIGGDSFPMLDGGGNASVVLANNNEVAGLHFANAGFENNSAIYGKNVTGFNIHDNIFESNGDGIGIYTNTGSSTGTIAYNQFTNNGTGVYLYNYSHSGGSATQTVTVSNNTFSDNGTGIESVNNAKYDSTATQAVDITGNTLTGNNVGISLINTSKYGGYGDTSTATQTANLSGNVATGNSFAGLVALNLSKYNTATQTVNISGSNQFNNNDKYGADFRNYGKYANGTQNVNISGSNQFNNNGGDGAVFSNYGAKYGTATQNVAITGSNQFNDNNQAGYGAYAPALIGHGFFDYSRWSGKYNSNAGFFNFANKYGTANQNVTISGTNQFNGSATGSGLMAINYSAALTYGSKYGSTATQSFNMAGSADQFNNNSQSGLYAYNGAVTYDSEYGDVTATQTFDMSGGSQQFNNNGYSGLTAHNTSYVDGHLYGYGTATQSFNLSGGSQQFNNNGGAGIYASNYANIGDLDYGTSTATQSLDLSGGAHQINGNHYDGIYVSNYSKYGSVGEAYLTATQTLNISGSGNVVTGNGDWGVNAYNGSKYTNPGDTVQNLNLTGADLSGNGSGSCYYKYYGGITNITGGSCTGGGPP